ncbi:hypothetical protein C5C31_01525 [Rathayibacter rathayi]|nr:hypothetical protein C5C02_00840 [Rathayibacter rathayi]PPG79020.1 hypothetical protein C5C23_00980 [Rathayibacter rathayi]PPG90346.1 hypothetical protein C5C47_02075 [Rathayibacter rathayi]PPH26502.1 hypothetical protein C5C31_01525 [Rathayibacter rathayi]PPI76631.1 hypothetical protein C5E03_07935 [Rathayibacter rathayi]
MPVQRRTASSYAQTPEGVDAVLKEHATARRFGLATRLVGELDVPFPSTVAVALDDQAQFDPMDVSPRSPPTSAPLATLWCRVCAPSACAPLPPCRCAPAPDR